MKSGGAFYQTTRTSFTHLKFGVENEEKESQLASNARSQSEVLRRKSARSESSLFRSTFDWAVCSEPLAFAADAGLWVFNRQLAFGAWRKVGIGGEMGGRGSHDKHNLRRIQVSKAE
jgi:hypothetical protein